VQHAPPPPPPDYSYSPAPAAITEVLADPDATIEVLVLSHKTGPGPTLRGFSIVRRETLQGIQRDRVAADLTSAVTYGKINGFCSSTGIGLHLASKSRGAVDVWIDPDAARIEILGSAPRELALSMSGVRLFSDLRRQISGEGNCG
jgi:hypothetical protein